MYRNWGTSLFDSRRIHSALVRGLSLAATAFLLPISAGAEPGLDTRPSNQTCMAPAPIIADSNIHLTRAFPRLRFSRPVALIQAPNDSSHWYVAERNGRVLRFTDNEDVSSTSVTLDITNQVAFDTEGGLMGIAFHPDFTRNGYMYLSYTGPNPRSGSPFISYISRFSTTDGGASFNPGSEQVLISFDQPSVFHNNGHILFGPDGNLYIGSGDGGPLGDASNNGQNRNNLFSAILRIDVDRGSPYSIPPDNPFASGGGAPEIYAWGLRNPWRFSFDRATGELWAGDVGERNQEEVNIVMRGRNYGWSIMEGDACFDATSCNRSGLTNPVATYSHARGCAITGGYVYRGNAIPELQGLYLYSDYCSGTVWTLTNSGGNNYDSDVLLESGQRIVSFVEDQNGELYLVSFTGELFSIQSSQGATSPGSFPERLSETGCLDASDPTRPAPGVIPFDVISPLWSDGAGKERFLAIPDGETIHIDADNDWEFPIGTVLIKSFRIQDRIIETRLLAHHDDGAWRGYAYEWNEAQTDATLIPAGEQVSRTVDGQLWNYPTRAQCLQCHTSGAKRALAPESAQLNRTITYPSTGISGNQLETFDHIGMFDRPLSSPPAELPTMAAPDDTSKPLNDRARAYLHANCSNCHREGGSTSLSLDMRYNVAEADTGICDEPPSAGNLGLSDARIISTGDPSRSVLLQRMLNTDNTRMPPVGTTIVDSEGAELISSWIAQGVACSSERATDVEVGDGDDDSNGGSDVVSAGGGGGGGCTLRATARSADYSLLALLLVSLVFVMFRSNKTNKAKSGDVST